ncbi:MAG: LUD domain-containing protein [Balneolaceae bacterium]
MASRDDILKAVRQNKPEPVPHPGIPDFTHRMAEPLIERFVEEIEKAGGSVANLQHRNDLRSELMDRYQPSVTWSAVQGLSLPDALSDSALSAPDTRPGEGHTVKNTLPDSDHSVENTTPDSVLTVERMEKLDLVVLKGDIGVAENGAVWVSGEILQRRVLPFISLNLAILLPASAIVENLHIAYEKLQESTHSFGTFICGPSKTADIEQSLVMGAHGPATATVYLIEE